MAKAFIITDSTTPGMVFSTSQSGKLGSNTGVWVSESDQALKFFSENDALSFVSVFIRSHIQICRIMALEVKDKK